MSPDAGPCWINAWRGYFKNFSCWIIPRWALVQVDFFFGGGRGDMCDCRKSKLTIKNILDELKRDMTPPLHNIRCMMTGMRHGGSRLIDNHLGVCHLTTATFLTCHCPYEKVTLVLLMSHQISWPHDAAKHLYWGVVEAVGCIFSEALVVWMLITFF